MPHKALAVRRAAPSVHQSLVEELENAVANRDIGSRVTVIQRVTDLFDIGSSCFTAEQMTLFDSVMGRLVREIDHSARVAFGERLSSMTIAPAGVSRALALDHSIEVAGPFLIHSEQLDDDTLIKGAKTKSQQHLLAISQRKSLVEGITDVLAERGDEHVAISVASNTGARFSDYGFSTLAKRSTTDEALALKMWSRPEVPREHLMKIFVKSSEALRKKLGNVDQSKMPLIQDMIKQASDQIQTQARGTSPAFERAEKEVQILHLAGELTEARLRKYADARKFEETTIALSLLLGIPVGAIERALAHDKSDQILVLGKYLNFSWGTTNAILLMQVSITGTSNSELERCSIAYSKLSQKTAKMAIQFYKLKERAV